MQLMRLIIAGLVLAGLSGCEKEAPPPVFVVNRPPPSLAQVEAHVLAFSAVLATSNRELVDQLHPPRSEREAKAMTRTLADSWGVHNRAELLDLLSGLEQGTYGHRAAFHKKLESLEGVSSEKIMQWILADGDDEVERNLIVVSYLRTPKPQTLRFTAWDYGRYINVCRWGFGAGYISEEEVWTRIVPVARMLQRSYSSWQEFSDDYIAGREFWSPAAMRQNGDEMRKIVAELFYPGSGSGTTQDPIIFRGLWKSIRWEESLGDGPIAEDLYAKSLHLPAEPVLDSKSPPTHREKAKPRI